MSAPRFEDRMPTYEELRTQLPPQLPNYLVKQRWFGSKARGIRSANIVDLIPFPDRRSEAFGLLARVEYDAGCAETYVLLVHCARAGDPADGESEAAVLTIQLGADHPDWVLRDALQDEEFLRALLLALEQNGVMRGVHGELRASHTSEFVELRASRGESLQAKLLKGEQSNSSVVYGERFILKIFRRLAEGVNPDFEIGMFLTEKTHFQNTPPLAGWIEYQVAGEKRATLAILQGFVPNQGDAWRFTLESLSRFWRDVAQIQEDSKDRVNEPVTSPLAQKDISAVLRESIGDYLKAVNLLAKRTAQLHVALASEPLDPEFAPEPFTERFRQELEASVRELTQQNLALLRSKADGLPPETRGDAGRLLGRETELLNKLHWTLRGGLQATRTRIHGDYHLGQVLFTGSDFMIIDFEGEPARPLNERRRKRTPLQDVAGMLRSFDYAAHTSLADYTASRPEARNNMPPLRALAEKWCALVSSVFLEQYLQESKGASYLPSNRSEISKLLEFHLLEKAIYELGYELNNRPSWVGVPLSGIGALLDSQNHGVAHSAGESGIC